MATLAFHLKELKNAGLATCTRNGRSLIYSAAMHVHVGVKNLEESVRFYSALSGVEPAKLKPDYAKWMLEDPHLNFVISTRSGKTGVDHMGLQVDDADELAALRDHMSAANISTYSDGETTCCYAKSEKSWVEDPNGVAWEAYHTMEDAQIFGVGHSASKTGLSVCCEFDPTVYPKGTPVSDREPGQ